MALIVEDGTGLSNAESFCSVIEASSYFQARGNESWADVENKEAALRKATDYMQGAYRGRWKGYRATQTQALEWPRRNIWFDDLIIQHNSVPVEVRRACAELALLSNSADLMPNLERAKSSVTVGPISVQYDSSSEEYTRYRNVEALLQPFLNGGAMTMKLVR